MRIYLKALFLDFKTVPDLASHFSDFVFVFCHPFPSFRYFSPFFFCPFLLWVILLCILHILFPKCMCLVTHTRKLELVKIAVVNLKKLQNSKIFIMVSLKILFSTFNRLPLQYISDLVYLAWYINLSGFVMQKYMSKQVLRIRKRNYIPTENRNVH